MGRRDAQPDRQGRRPGDGRQWSAGEDDTIDRIALPRPPLDANRAMAALIDQAARIASDFDTVSARSKANARSVLLGEFGAYDRSGTPTEDRVRYTETVRRTAQAHRFP